jgi:hypothetical protein
MLIEAHRKPSHFAAGWHFGDAQHYINDARSSLLQAAKHGALPLKDLIEIICPESRV